MMPFSFSVHSLWLRQRTQTNNTKKGENIQTQATDTATLIESKRMTNERNHSHRKAQAETIPINNVYLKLLLNYMCSLRCKRNSIQTKYGVYRFHVRHSE